jgi:MSHA biogenesis protein MshO
MSAHLDTARRSTLAAELDATTARLREDFATALPGSVRLRQIGTRWFLEYLEVRASGRYRSAPAAPAVAQSCPATCSAPNANDTMEFASCSESCFVSLGPLDGGVPVAGSDWVVIAPTAASPYAAAQRSRLQGTLAVAGGSRVTMTAHNFPIAATNKRFYVVASPVTYECNPATRRLTRHSGYAIAAAQPVAFAGAVSAPLATNVALCDLPRIQPTVGGVLVSMRLRYDRPVTGLGAGSVEAVDSFSEFGVKELP